MIRVGNGLTLRGNGPESLSRRHQGQDWHDGAATQARIAAREAVSLELGGSSGYDSGLRFNRWEMLAKCFPHSECVYQGGFGIAESTPPPKRV